MFNKRFGIAADATYVFIKQLTWGRTFKCFCNVNSGCWASITRLTTFKTVKSQRILNAGSVPWLYCFDFRKKKEK